MGANDNNPIQISRLARFLYAVALLSVHEVVNAARFPGLFVYGLALIVEQVLLFACIVVILRYAPHSRRMRLNMSGAIYVMATTSILVHMWSNWVSAGH